MKKSILKRLTVGMLVSIMMLNIGDIYAEARTLKKNYNKGYYYSHGMSGAVSNNKNWMGFIDDNKNISELSIPGTHDTMANYELTNMVRTQSMSLQGQLESGIRYIDIRCNYADGKFKINHGPIGLKYDFDDVLNVVTKFLKENPTESVFMRIKQENSNKSDYEFDLKLKEYVGKYHEYFWQNTTYTHNPKLGDVRGKIVVFNDVWGSSVGLNYRSIDKQDNYNLDTNWSLYYKWQDIKNHLNKARNGDKDTVYMNYLSASGGSFPYFVASGQSSPEMSAPRLSTGLVGPVFKDWYPDFPRGNADDILFEGTNILTTANIENNPGRVGIIAADFPGKGLIDTVISKNDFGTKDYISVGGVNYNGDVALEGLRINLDYSNKYIYLTNRINESIHAGFGNSKFFKFRLLDKNNNEKVSVELNGNDKPTDSKYDKLNFVKFEEGDIVEIYHEEPFRLIISDNKQYTKEQSYIITKNGLEVKDEIINNSVVKISGSGGASFDLVFNKNKITVANKTGEYFGKKYSNGYYAEVGIFTNDGRLKGQSRIYWNTYSTNVELDKLNNINYEYGDILKISHQEPKYVKIKAPILGEQSSTNYQQYEITKLGLKVIK